MSPEPIIPIVYVETNFVVGLKAPHDRLHLNARALFEASEQGRCRLVLPYVVVLEASARLSRSYDSLLDEIAALEDTVARLQLVRPDLFEGMDSPIGGRKLREYLSQDPREDALAFASSLAVPFQEEDLSVMETLRARLPNLRGRDMVDLVILSQIYGHRTRAGSEAPAVLVSSNTKELDPKRSSHSELPAIYEEMRMVFMDLNNRKGLPEALGRWKRRYRDPQEES